MTLRDELDLLDRQVRAGEDGLTTRTNPLEILSFALRAMAECDRLTKALSEANAKLAEAQRDARRYRWLRDNWRGFDYLRTDYAKTLRLNIDKMIDAALSAQAGADQGRKET